MSGSLLPPIPTYLAYAAREPIDAANSAAIDGAATALTAHFLEAAPTILTPNALLADYKSLQVVLGAFGLSSKINDTGILRQLLTQDPTSTTSLAYRLGDAKYLAFAKALSNFSTPPFAKPADAAAIVKSYQINRFEANAGAQATGLQQALYYTRNIGQVKSITQLQSDPDLLAVVVTGLGLPLTNFQLLSFEQQTSILKSKVNIAQFTQPAAVQRIAEQYLVSQQVSGSTGSTAPPPGSLLSLFSNTAASGANSILQIIDPSAVSSTGTTSNLLSLFA